MRSNEHLAGAAKSAEDIPCLVMEMNAALGWDIRKGLDPLPSEETGESDG